MATPTLHEFLEHMRRVLRDNKTDKLKAREHVNDIQERLDLARIVRKLEEIDRNRLPWLA